MTTATATTTKWNIDKGHSQIEFKAKHMMITTVSGSVKEFDATIETEEEDFSTAKIHFEGDVKSVTTGNEQRDGHLMTDDFFNPSTFPKMTFDSTGMVKKDATHFTLNGLLTIRDITKPISLDVEFEGKAVDSRGNTKFGFTLNGKINRMEFGLKWNVVTEAGGILLSDEVKISASVQITKA